MRNVERIARIKQIACGRWIEILHLLGGVLIEALDGKHHPCPKCGGTDRFRMISEEDGALFCNQCFSRKNGDGIAALRWLRGWALGEALDRLDEYLGVQRGSRPREIADTYDYCDEQGDPLFQVVRYEPKSFRQRRPDGEGGWIWKLGNCRRVPYQLPGLIAAADDVPVFICEGEKDVNRLVALDLVATCLPGGAGKWRAEYVEHFSTRNVVILPDNDDAGQRGAEGIAKAIRNVAASVRVVNLPNLQAKGDVSDWLDAEGTRVELLELVERQPLWKPQDETSNCARLYRPAYRATERGLVWVRPNNDEDEKPLTNFVARIVEDVVIDDGMHERRELTIEVTLESESYRFRVSAEEFESMRWVMAKLGPSAVVYMGNGIRDRAREAIQLLSTDTKKRRIYRHLGWRRVDNEWMFLHAGGGISRRGLQTDVVVEPDESLTRYNLPAPSSGEQLKADIESTLKLLDVANREVGNVLLASAFRAPLGPADFGVLLIGPTGAGKSELASLAQRHFGARMDARNLPANWSSTANALESLAFEAKDALIVVDDFVPHGSQRDADSLNRKAERILRGAGNGAGRQRSRVDGSLQMTRRTRGLILSTGEDVPMGQSLLSRTIVVELGPNDVNFEMLSKCQIDADAGAYARVMSAYLKWLATHYPDEIGNWHAQVQKLRTDLVESGHRRTPDIVANLALGLQLFADFATGNNAFDSDRAERFCRDGASAITAVGRRQRDFQSVNDFVEQFFRYLSIAFEKGYAHIVSKNGGAPDSAIEWGWWHHNAHESEGSPSKLLPRGECIGRFGNGCIHLCSAASFAMAKRIASELGESFCVNTKTLHKRIDERNLLLQKDGRRHTTRKDVAGNRVRVLTLRFVAFSDDAVPSVQVDRSGENPGQIQDPFGDLSRPTGPKLNGANGMYGADWPGRTARTGLNEPRSEK